MDDEPATTVGPPAAVLPRRRALGLFAGLGLAALAGCGSGSDSGSGASGSSSRASSSTTTGSNGDRAGSCEPAPEEIAGPFPADGSNGPDVLAQDGVVRQDIRPSFGSATGVAEGVPLTIELTVVDAADGCSPRPGAAVYLWHCTRDGEYSQYGSVAAENFLRGVQEAGADGKVTFTSIFPGAYPGRWPHAHFTVYGSLADATGGGPELVTSQLALPADACQQAYATDGYRRSDRILDGTSLDADMVFSDGYDRQLATVTGDADRGYVARLTVPA